MPLRRRSQAARSHTLRPRRRSCSPAAHPASQMRGAGGGRTDRVFLWMCQRCWMNPVWEEMEERGRQVKPLPAQRKCPDAAHTLRADPTTLYFYLSFNRLASRGSLEEDRCRNCLTLRGNIDRCVGSRSRPESSWELTDTCLYMRYMKMRSTETMQVSRTRPVDLA